MEPQFIIFASRIAAKVYEILIPEPVRHLLSSKSFGFSDRGEFAMKASTMPSASTKCTGGSSF